MHRIAAGVVGCLQAITAQTYVVDAAGGPGSHHVSIAAAIPAVPEGSTLLVRAGTYEPFSSSKGLTILGEPGARIDGSNGIFGIAQIQAEHAAPIDPDQVGELLQRHRFGRGRHRFENGEAAVEALDRRRIVGRLPSHD